MQSNQFKKIDDERLSEMSLTSERVLTVVNRIAPLWPLERFVSVHPFVNEKAQSLLDLSEKLSPILESQMFPSRDFFRTLYKQGRLTRADIEQAIYESDIPVIEMPSRVQILKLLDEVPSSRLQAGRDREPSGLQLPSHLFQEKNQLGSYFSDHFGKWAASIFSQDRSLFELRDKTTHFYEAWRQLIKKDRSLNIQGFKSLKAKLDELGLDYREVLNEAQDSFGLNDQDFEKIILKCAYDIAGWVAYARFLDRESAQERSINSLALQVLTARLSYEVAIIKANLINVDKWRTSWEKSSIRNNNESIDIVLDTLLRASEHNLRSRIAEQISSSRLNPRVSDSESRSKFQFVLCIDARSEILRRNLERLSPTIETVGFAGFFGLTLASRSEFGEISSRCPVLLNPSIFVQQMNENISDDTAITWRPLSLLHEAIKKSAITTFSYVEALGLGYLAALIVRTLKIKSKEKKPSLMPIKLVDGQQSEMSLSAKIAFARSFLKNSGLVGRLGEVVVLTGHGSETLNNAHASGLDCGACGGHKGDVNASVAASILNRKDVRLVLKGSEFEIPESTHFVAALHNTTTQEIRLDEGTLSGVEEETRQQLADYIKEAVEFANTERALIESRSDSKKASVQALAKSRDWSDTQPEWGLARNALFIAGRRSLTKDINLEGRSFLHDYDQSQDKDLSTLELILTAPLVVAQWINAQYYMSTVDPKNFGAGTKVLHNVVGSIGVFEGASYQLRVGLPEQSVFSDGKYFHQPLRLQVFVEATTEAIESIIKKHEVLQTLIASRWITISSIDPQSAHYETILPRTV